MEGKKLVANSVHIHFELSIDLLNHCKISDFSLHYEPNPYKPKKDYLPIKGYNEYNHLRKERVEYFHKAINSLNLKSSFKLRNGSNSILKFDLKNHKRFEDVLGEIISIMEEISPLVDDMLKVT